MFNNTSDLSLVPQESISFPVGVDDVMGVWASGSLPNGVWEGFPSWAIRRDDYFDGSVIALAAVISDTQ